LEIFAQAGAQKIYERVKALTEDLVGRLKDGGFELKGAADAAHRSGIVLVRHADAPGAVNRLALRGIIVDHRAGYVRVSPHFYNTVAENEAFVAAMREV
jgi:selenocysteine lyase/cysteine desulfurase